MSEAKDQLNADTIGALLNRVHDMQQSFQSAAHLSNNPTFNLESQSLQNDEQWCTLLLGCFASRETDVASDASSNQRITLRQVATQIPSASGLAYNPTSAYAGEPSGASATASSEPNLAESRSRLFGGLDAAESDLMVKALQYALQSMGLASIPTQLAQTHRAAPDLDAVGFRQVQRLEFRLAEAKQEYQTLVQDLANNHGKKVEDLWTDIDSLQRQQQTEITDLRSTTSEMRTAMDELRPTPGREQASTAAS